MLLSTNGFDEESMSKELEAIAILHDMMRAVYREGKQLILPAS